MKFLKSDVNGLLFHIKSVSGANPAISHLANYNNYPYNKRTKFIYFIFYDV